MHFPYIMKDDSSEELYKSLTNRELILDQSKKCIKINHLCCPLLGTLNCDSKCCIVICIVEVNITIVAQAYLELCQISMMELFCENS